MIYIWWIQSELFAAWTVFFFIRFQLRKQSGLGFRLKPTTVQILQTKMTYRLSAVNSAIVPAEPNDVSAQYVAFVIAYSPFWRLSSRVTRQKPASWIATSSNKKNNH